MGGTGADYGRQELTMHWLNQSNTIECAKCKYHFAFSDPICPECSEPSHVQKCMIEDADGVQWFAERKGDKWVSAETDVLIFTRDTEGVPLKDVHWSPVITVAQREAEIREQKMFHLREMFHGHPAHSKEFNAHQREQFHRLLDEKEHPLHAFAHEHRKAIES